MSMKKPRNAEDSLQGPVSEGWMTLNDNTKRIIIFIEKKNDQREGSATEFWKRTMNGLIRLHIP